LVQALVDTIHLFQSTSFYEVISISLTS
jgi:hypothetical protein